MPLFAPLIHAFWDQIAPPTKGSTAPTPYHLITLDCAYQIGAIGDRPPVLASIPIAEYAPI